MSSEGFVRRARAPKCKSTNAAAPQQTNKERAANNTQRAARARTCVAMKVVSPTDLPTFASAAMGRKCAGARGVAYSRESAAA